jgi:thiol-disulfide isomerase/thioredoxin
MGRLLLTSVLGGLLIGALGCSSDTTDDQDAATTGTDGTSAVDGTSATDGTGGTDGTDSTETSQCPANFVDQAGSTCEADANMLEFELEDCEGNKVKLSDVLCEAKATLVYFGAGWCAPCRDKQEKLVAWDEKYAPLGLQTVVILRENAGPDDPATKTFCKAWKEQYNEPFHVLIDPLNRVTGSCLGTDAFPVSVVVGEQWNVVYREAGEADSLESVIQALVQ